MILDLASPLGMRLGKAQGRIESGMLANMRTYRLPARPAVHTRILGEDRTLCGRSLHHNDQWAWQFIHRGSVLEGHPPSGSRDHRYGRSCKRCNRSPVLVACFAIADARSRAVSRTRAKEVGW